MTKPTKSKQQDVIAHDTLDTLIGTLRTKKRARFMNLGLFRVIEIKGRQRWDFRQKKMVTIPKFKTLVFTPAEGIKDLLNPSRKKKA